MKTSHTLTKKIVLTLLFGSVIGLSGIDAVMSRDTDIYFSNPNAQQQAIKPNILLILDTSGSMVSQLSPGRQNAPCSHERGVRYHSGQCAKRKGRVDAVFRRAWRTGAYSRCKRYRQHDGGHEGRNVFSISSAISSANDDAEQTTSGGSAGTVTLNSPDLDMVTQTDTQIIGLRFQNVQVPRGATITSAHIRFQVDESDSGATSLTIKGQNSGNAPAFSTATNNISNRTSAGNATPTAVSWNSIPAWTVGSRRSEAWSEPRHQGYRK